MSSDLASRIISDVLLVCIYGACVAIVLVQVGISVLMNRLDVEARVVRVEKAKADHIAALEADWPQYVISELP